MRKFPIVNRTHYSILTAYSKPSEIAQKAKELGYDTVGLCDIGNISGVVDFVDSCKKEGVRPIIGCEINGHKIFAKNYRGWKQLIQISTSWNCDEVFDQGCLGSSDLLFTTDELRESRYIEKSDSEIYAIIRSLSNKCRIADLKTIEKVEGLHFPLPEEIPDHPIYDEIDKIESFKITGPPKLPHFKCEGGEVAYLRKLVNDAFDKYKLKLKPDMIPVYENRIAYEMKVIEMANLAGYFLIVQDFVTKARSDGQLCAIGRGSAAGSLVSYLIGITLIDPIPYGLLFSRFFNASRAYPKHVDFSECPFIDEYRDYETIYSRESKNEHSPKS